MCGGTANASAPGSAAVHTSNKPGRELATLHGTNKHSHVLGFLVTREQSGRTSPSRNRHKRGHKTSTTRLPKGSFNRYKSGRKTSASTSATEEVRAKDLHPPPSAQPISRAYTNQQTNPLLTESCTNHSHAQTAETNSSPPSYRLLSPSTCTNCCCTRTHTPRWQIFATHTVVCGVSSWFQCPRKHVGRCTEEETGSNVNQGHKGVRGGGVAGGYLSERWAEGRLARWPSRICSVQRSTKFPRNFPEISSFPPTISLPVHSDILGVRGRATAYDTPITQILIFIV